MSGALMLVDAVLGGLSMTTKAYERYRELSVTISDFRHAPRELSNIQVTVNAQHLRFEDGAGRLRSAIEKNRESIESWTSSQSEAVSGSPTDSILQRDFENCRRLMNQIADSLNSTRKQLSAIGMEIQEIPSVTTPCPLKDNTVSQKIKLGNRVKFALGKKSELKNRIEELRSLNSDFYSGVSRIIENINEIQGRPTAIPDISLTQPKRPITSINLVERCQQIRLASNHLYDTLAARWSCSSHQRHSASVVCVDGYESTHNHPVRFDFAVSPGAPNSQPLWLEIECLNSSGNLTEPATDPPKTTPGPLDGLDAALSNVLMISMSPTSKPKKPKVHFQDPSTPGPSEPSRLPADPRTGNGPRESGSTQPQTEAQSPDLVLIREFCAHFTTQSQAVQSQPRCLGHLGGHYLQKFYLPPLTRQYTGEPQSLASIISSANEHSARHSLPITHVLQVASSLAIAILQLYSTPWLPQSWQSHDINFYSQGNLSGGDAEMRLSSPHFQVQLERSIQNTTSNGHEDPTSVAQQPCIDPLSGAAQTQNLGLLFRFGIVLLELGFSRPWQGLMERGSSSLPPSEQSSYHVAEQLCKELKNMPKYQRIVRQCIKRGQCSKGPRTGLDNEDLRFLADAGIALKVSENGLRECL
ncbi:hypothetical protein B0T19DRAFT_487683 [Cercophora scortea]|uniref:DUF7580 domain-containing protein n=1 Tax=Cercophora scortea TaxID=314031 RepID=A0AAE0IAH5_9PEZI|nr:hypothetical protein B0T19DRAFT_487683 [Cercophora scortea]